MQFTLSVVLVTATIIISKQLSYIEDKDLGFEKEKLIYLNTGDFPSQKTQGLRDELKRYSSIGNASAATNSLVDVINSTVGFSWQGQADGDNFLITELNADPSYIPTTGMRLLTGRNFEEGRRADTASYIINETAAKRMGWRPEEALGKSIAIFQMPGHVIGVVEDFHFRPMTTAIEPFLLMDRNDRYYSGILIRAVQVREALADIAKAYKNFEAGTSPHYNFVDQQLDQQYRLQQTTGKLVLFFSALAILVACLGLYGLAAFTTERRTKEIGIRKVLGASIANVSMLLSKDFVSLVIVSIGLASPLAYFLMRSWLQSFIYRIELSWIFFAIAGLLALSIAAATVLYQAIAAARMNPVTSLRTE
jgi:putative ABC transport system permease protein